jgi:hypothetical protein
MIHIETCNAEVQPDYPEKINKNKNKITVVQEQKKKDEKKRWTKLSGDEKKSGKNEKKSGQSCPEMKKKWTKTKLSKPVKK